MLQYDLGYEALGPVVLDKCSSFRGGGGWVPIAYEGSTRCLILFFMSRSPDLDRTLATDAPLIMFRQKLQKERKTPEEVSKETKLIRFTEHSVCVLAAMWRSGVGHD